MRRKFIILLSCIVSVLPTLAQEKDSTFAAATQAYQSGNYDVAIADYEKLVASGNYSGEIFYNLAAAYQMTGKPVLAVLNYRRALMLNPSMLQARRNLELIEKSDGIPMPRFTWREEISGIIPPSWMIYGGAVVGWAGALLLVCAFLRPKPRFWWISISVVLFLGGKSAAVVGYICDPKVADAEAAVVTAEKTSIAHSSPAESSPSVAKLVPGTGVNILSKRDTWSYCLLQDGSTAWISSQDLTDVVP